MDKDEILKKYREEKGDEGTAYIESKGRSYGTVGFFALFIVIVFFNLFKGQDNFVPFTLFWAYDAAEAYGKYTVTKKKIYLTTTVLCAIASVCFLACYILKVVKG